MEIYRKQIHNFDFSRWYVVFYINEVAEKYLSKGYTLERLLKSIQHGIFYAGSVKCLGADIFSRPLDHN